MQSIFTSDITLIQFLLAIGVSLILGLIIALTYKFDTKGTNSFITTVALLPAIICIVIIMVNGNIGAGVAVAGTFSLVRFRSIPGSAKEICMIFLAMGIGLVTGMGYLVLAAIFTVVMCLVFILYSKLFKESEAKSYKIVIPEDLDYPGVFEELFSKYASSYELTQVKTVNMGSMYKLTYDVELKDLTKEKQLIDEIRCRNGNLEVSVSKHSTENVL